MEREPVLRSVDGSVALRRIAHESINAGVPETVVELGGTDTYPLFSPAARALATGLAGWGLEEAAFVTELVVSELVTNAIRYGQEPVQLRLVRDRTLSCEVSDGSNTAPHLRRAWTFDEGGRGLLLVAQLTRSWGTRQTSRGKTIWAEQPLPVSPEPIID